MWVLDIKKSCDCFQYAAQEWRENRIGLILLNPIGLYLTIQTDLILYSLT